MKKLLLSALALIPFVSSAQDLTDAQKAALDAASTISNAQEPAPVVEKPKYWTNSFVFDLGFNQTYMTNWAAGGYPTIALAVGMDGRADYAKDLLNWNNRLQLNYGFLWSADKINLIQKSNDRIYLESKFTYKTGSESKWNYSASFDFRSQFSNSFDNYKQEDPTNPKSKWYGDLKSGLLSPAYTNLALGMEWKPTNWFNLNISPLTGGFTIVTIADLRKNYGMTLKPEYAEVPKPTGDMYRSALFQFGAQIKADVKVNINDTFKYETQLVLFTDYLRNPFVETRINWDNSISWQAAKFFKIGLNTWMIYDPAVTIKNKDGVECKSLLQFKEFLSLNFTYTIASKKN